MVEVDAKEMRVRCRKDPTIWVIRSALQARQSDLTDGSEPKNPVLAEVTSNSPTPNPEASEFVPTCGKFFRLHYCLPAVLQMDFYLNVLTRCTLHSRTQNDPQSALVNYLLLWTHLRVFVFYL